MNKAFFKFGAYALLFICWAVLVVLNVNIMSPRLIPLVRTEPLKSAPLELMVRAPGTIQPVKTETLKAEFDGPVVKKAFKEGDRVKPGQFLLEVGRDNIQMEYLSRSNDLKNAQLKFRKAVNELKLQKILYKKNAIPMSTVEEARQGLDRAQQDLETSSASFKLTQELWDKNVLLAPFAGTITADYIGQDQSVSAGKEVLSIGDLSSYSMNVRVDELDIGQIKLGQQARIRLQALEDRPLKAVVSKIGTQSEEKGIAQYAVTLDLDRSKPLPLLPQFTGESRILTGKTEPVLSVPLTAVAAQGDKQTVLVVNSMNRLVSRTVELGRSNPERVEITKGLSQGDLICVSADAPVKSGMRVRTDE